MPVVGGSGAEDDPRRPKYYFDLMNADYRTKPMYYGLEPWCICLVMPTPSAAHHAYLTSDPQVWAFPKNLDQAVSINSTLIAQKLEAVNMPSDWIGPATTYRQILRAIRRYCAFLQRFHGRSRLIAQFFASVSLDTTVGEISQAARAKLAETADSFGIDRSWVTLDTTMRQLIKVIGSGIVEIDGTEEAA